MTVGGISGAGIIENTETPDGVAANGTLMVNIAAGSSSSYSGYLRNNAGGSGSWRWSKTAPARLTLTGNNVGLYTGGLTVNAGMLNYSGAARRCRTAITRSTAACSAPAADRSR